MPAWLKNELQEAEFIPKLALPLTDEEPDKESNEQDTSDWVQVRAA